MEIEKINVKTQIIILVVTFAMGAMIGGGSVYKYTKKMAKSKEVYVEDIETSGDIEKIVHEDLKITRKKFSFVTKAKEKGKIKTTIEKKLLCPEITRKNILSVQILPEYNNSFYIKYGILYQRIMRHRLILGFSGHIMHDFKGGGVGFHIGILF